MVTTQPTGSSPTSINSYGVSPKIDLYDASLLSPSHSIGFGAPLKGRRQFKATLILDRRKYQQTPPSFCGVSGKLSSFSAFRNISNQTDYINFLHGDHFSQASRLDRGSYWVKHAFGL
jgi:hypothetical protein